jgi:hypothetical protein
MVSRMIRLGCRGIFYHLEHHKNKNMILNLLIHMMIGTIADNILNKIKIFLKHSINFLHPNKNQMQDFWMNFNRLIRIHNHLTNQIYQISNKEITIFCKNNCRQSSNKISIIKIIIIKNMIYNITINTHWQFKRIIWINQMIKVIHK